MFFRHSQAVAPLLLASTAALLLQTTAIAQQTAPDASSIADDADTESPLLVEPATPQEQFDAVLLMLRLGRPKLARGYMQNLLDAGPDEATLLQLRDEHGAAVFLRLATNRDLQPLSVQLMEQVTAAFRRNASDPQRIDALVSDLTSTPRRREAALIALRNAGQPAVPRLIHHLANPATVGSHDLVASALIRIGEEAIPPLLGALQASDAPFKAAVIDVLGRLQSPRIVPYLWHPAFANDELPGVRIAAVQALARLLKRSVEKADEVSRFRAADELKRVALEHFGGRFPWSTDDQGNVSLWIWQHGAMTVERTLLSPQAASAYLATHFSRQGLALTPEREDLQALSLAAALALAVERNGWDEPLPTGPGTVHDLALVAGGELVAASLAEALESANSAAAFGALQILGQVGTENEVASGSLQESPLVAALNYPDDRIQFAAANAIMEIDPSSQFSAAHRVVSVLTRALTGSAVDRAVVIDARVQRATKVAGFLREMGYAPEIASTGQAGFKLTAHTAGVELIAVHVNCIRWGLSQTIANLRADARTAAIPIAVYGPEETKPRVASLLQRYPFTTYVIEAASTDFFHSQLRPFLQEISPPSPSAAQRVAMQSQALYWLALISSGQRTRSYNLAPAEAALTRLAGEPPFSDNALLALAAVPTASAQRFLQTLTVNEINDAGVRESAARQLAFHIQRFGLRLKSSELDALQESRTTAATPRLATALASVIGLIRSYDERAGTKLPTIPQPLPPSQ